MKLFTGLLVYLFALAACQAFSEHPVKTDAETQTVYPSHSLTTDEPIYEDNWTLHSGEVDLKIKVPRGWQTYNTRDGIVLNERMGSVEDGPTLRGILIHIFVPSTDEFDFPSDEEVNVAWAVLSQVVANRDYVGDALVSAPVAFDWDHHDAAYYLLNNRDSTVTLLLAMSLPRSHKLVVCHVSSPEGQAGRIRALLPELLESLTVNDISIRSSALDHLPDPLVFPIDDTPRQRS